MEWVKKITKDEQKILIPDMMSLKGQISFRSSSLILIIWRWILGSACRNVVIFLEEFEDS